MCASDYTVAGQETVRHQPRCVCVCSVHAVVIIIIIHISVVVPMYMTRRDDLSVSRSATVIHGWRRFRQ